MRQQALPLTVKWDHETGGRAATGKEGWRERREGGRGRAVFKDAAAMGKLPPTHGIDAVHLAQWEMTADYSAIPLSTYVLPRVLHSLQKHDTAIHQGRRGVTERVIDTDAERTGIHLNVGEGCMSEKREDREEERSL